MLTHDPTSQRYTLTVPFNIPIVEPHIVDEYTVKVILPELAYDIEIDTPWDTERSESRRFTYLDLPSAGRPVQELRSRNLVHHHKGNLVVRYSMPPLHMWREPLMLVSAFFVVFAGAALVSRLDLRISPRST